MYDLVIHVSLKRVLGPNWRILSWDYFLRARTKNEKKHLQRAAKAREKREAEEAAAALAATSAATTVMQNEIQSKQSDSGTITWSESFTSVLCHRKFMVLAKQLQE